MTDDLPQKFVPAVQNATTIQRLLASAGRPMGVTQIARETGLNVSSVFNILRTLSHEGLASFDPINKTYETGLGVLELAQPLLGANPSDLLRPICRDIAQRHNVMLALWQITTTERIILIDAFSAPKLVQAVISPQSRLPVFVGAVGRVYAATLKLNKAETRAGFNSVRWQKPLDFEDYWKDVQTARQTRRAEDRGYLFRGLDIVASIVRDGEGLPRLGLSSITISEQLDDSQLDDVSQSLVTAATQIERSLFGFLGDA
ncbi:helix-turn-helix domain-containing protein [uncultured Cohaesibacter sp.]|uniref:IclR family transcriptional regulator n=1 Tax=uncultured Cohaesibacter sp. TaxID=1002546 RepID=UPI0029C7A65E|nr:helix-turn-helix domain-containing protein [uncultured Cohaesibacter sp.]